MVVWLWMFELQPPLMVDLFLLCSVLRQLTVPICTMLLLRRGCLSRAVPTYSRTIPTVKITAVIQRTRYMTKLQRLKNEPWSLRRYFELQWSIRKIVVRYPKTDTVDRYTAHYWCASVVGNCKCKRIKTSLQPRICCTGFQLLGGRRQAWPSNRLWHYNVFFQLIHAKLQFPTHFPTLLL